MSIAPPALSRTTQAREFALNVLTGFFVLSALVSISMAVRRQLRPARPQVLALTTPLQDWRRFADRGAVIGESAAPVTVIEFSDFQCPFCAQAARRLARLRSQRPGLVQVHFRHFPLTSIHPHAHAAAVAAECAADAGKFEAFHDVVFAAQTQIGQLSWASLAARAGIRDTAQFERCRANPLIRERIAADVRAAESLQLEGTPALIINGVLVRGSPTPQQLSELVDAAARH